MRLRHQNEGVAKLSNQMIAQHPRFIKGQLGFPLFNRTSKGVSPTRYAEQLYGKSSAIMDLFHSIYSDIESETARAKITVAFSYGVLAYFEFNLIEQFHKNNPSIHLDYTEDTNSKIEAMIAQNQIDLAVIGLPIKIDLYNCHYLFSRRHVAVVNKMLPYAEKDFISYQDLSGQDIALIGRQFNPYHHNMQRFLLKQVLPKSFTETSEISHTHFFASQNSGLYFPLE